MFVKLKDKFSKVADDIFVYHSVNLLFGMVLVFVIIYSIIYKPGDHPLPALLSEITGLIPPSKGLSSSFSEIVRGNLNSALIYNPHGIRVFSFFGLQILFRLFFSMVLSQKFISVTAILIVDVTLSILLFVWSFAPLIAYTLKIFSSLVQNFF